MLPSLTYLFIACSFLYKLVLGILCAHADMLVFCVGNLAIMVSDEHVLSGEGLVNMTIVVKYLPRLNLVLLHLV